MIVHQHKHKQLQSADSRSALKRFLIEKLKQEKVFWSYAPESVTMESITDEQIVELTLIHSDLQEIDLLFELYSFKMVKDVWRKSLIPQGEYLYTLNRFLAWFYFGVKRPETYLKAMFTRHINSIQSI